MSKKPHYLKHWGFYDFAAYLSIHCKLLNHINFKLLLVTH
ncbi:hypothetical protein PTRA_a2977 [Pseudoalteromonas translucida KMM 520]|uniref:Uncharacterized protein n=1 Tax=Pseudoalteromonas translucida KMM 520 TaxID=1315283 RepID=A0A0U2WKY8_9GAMM|nr:hypothetical protein PTRA_a2977 [Pseudoalteromonas translucida KMM 520]